MDRKHTPFPEKIGYIIGTYPEITTTFIDREIQGIRERGFAVQILSIRHPDPAVFEQEKYARLREEIIYLLPPHIGHFLIAHGLFAVTRFQRYVRLLVYLLTRSHPSLQARLMTLLHFMEGVFAAYYLREKELDHLHAHFVDRAATVALCVGRLLDLPYSLTAHADEIFENPLILPEKINGSAFTITVSEFNKSHLLKSHALNPEKIFVLHPWVDLSVFTPPASRTSSLPFRILSIGRLVENKGHPYLIEACRQLKREGLRFECHIIGEGPQRETLEALINDAGLEKQVHLLGGQPQSTVREYLARADLFVLAAVIAKSGKRDGMPVSLAEAMAMELPVISTQIVGIGEMVRDGAGYLIPPREAASLASAIYDIYHLEPDRRKQMGQTGRAIITQDFNLQAGLDALAAHFQTSSGRK